MSTRSSRTGGPAAETVEEIVSFVADDIRIDIFQSQKTNKPSQPRMVRSITIRVDVKQIGNESIDVLVEYSQPGVG